MGHHWPSAPMQAAMVPLLIHGLSFAGHVFRAPWGQNQLWLGIEAAQQPWEGDLAPLSACPFLPASSCLSHLSCAHCPYGLP